MKEYDWESASSQSLLDEELMLTGPFGGTLRLLGPWLCLAPFALLSSDLRIFCSQKSGVRMLKPDRTVSQSSFTPFSAEQEFPWRLPRGPLSPCECGACSQVQGLPAGHN